MYLCPKILLGPKQNTIQIHPTLGCNLFCKHCYSNSGPYAFSSKLDLDILKKTITDAHHMGYKIVSFSGGEPLLYEGLNEILAHAKSYDMITTITSNGILLDDKRLSAVEKYLDLVAISIDGTPSIHNEIRGSTKAFDQMVAGINNVKRTGLKFGFIHTLTKNSWDSLLWITKFAIMHNASLLQIHPLEIIGRANNTDMISIAPDEDVLARVYLLNLALMNDYGNSISFQFDVFDRDYVIQHPELIYASDDKYDDIQNGSKPADLLSPIIVETNGSIVPISYGFCKKYEICNLNTQSLSEGWSTYIKNKRYDAFRTLCKTVLKEIATPSMLPFFNWYELITRRSFSDALFNK